MAFDIRNPPGGYIKNTLLYSIRQTSMFYKEIKKFTCGNMNAKSITVTNIHFLGLYLFKELENFLQCRYFLIFITN